MINYIKLTHQDYFYHISAMYVPNVVYTSRISHPYDIQSGTYFSHLNLRITLKSGPPPTSQNSLYFELWTFRFSALTPTPLLDFFHIFGTFLVLIASLSLKISLKHHKKIVSPPYLMFYACFFIFNYYRSLSIAIVLKYHFHYHYHYRSKSHYRTSLIPTAMKLRTP